MAINKGLALVSVADVLFFDPITDAYLGEGLALSNSTLTQEVQSIEQRGGYLNALLFDIKHSKTLTVELESATFKMEYLAFQTGTNIQTPLGGAGVYEFGDCVSFTAGKGTTSKTPIGNVYVRMPNGTVKTVTPTGKSIDIGMADFNGQSQVIYMYNDTVEALTIDTKTQPLTVKAVLRMHTLTQDGIEGYLEITVPRLKFDGSITLNLSSDAVSSFGLSGTAQEYADDCGNTYYAQVKRIPGEAEGEIAVESIVASPNVMNLGLGGNFASATANVIGVRTAPYANTTLDNSKLTFESSDNLTATVTPDGVVTAKKKGNTTIKVTYEGLQDLITVNVSEQG